MTKEEIEEARRRLGWGPEVSDEQLCLIVGGTMLHTRIAFCIATRRLKKALGAAFRFGKGKYK